MSDKCAGCGKSTENCNCFAPKAAPEKYHYVSWAELKAENERLKEWIEHVIKYYDETIGGLEVRAGKELLKEYAKEVTNGTNEK